MSRHRHSLLGGTTNQIISWGGINYITGSGVVIVPPANMRAGDLVYVYSIVGGGGVRALSILNTGGQSWTTLQIRNQEVSGLPGIWDSWCVFNGTWTANPQFSISGSLVSKASVMMVFRPPVVGGTWATDIGPTQGGVAGAGPVYTMPGITNTVDKPNVTVFVLMNYGEYASGPTGAAYWDMIGNNWYTFGGANERNGSFLYQIQKFIIPVGATGNPILTSVSSTTAQLTRHSWYFTAP